MDVNIHAAASAFEIPLFARGCHYVFIDFIVASSRFAPFVAVYCLAFFIYEPPKVAGNFDAVFCFSFFNLAANVANRGPTGLIKNSPPPRL